MVKSYGFSINYVLHGMSYANMIMYFSVLPTYSNLKSEEKGEKPINADDPANRDLVKQIINNAD